ncbi:MAG TPA: phosphatase PAP2 family protein [Turneriella sp.]|nr:phosphatase PAP2 family protein [Turneriella sp.]
MWIATLDHQIFEYLTLFANPPWLTALCERIGDMKSYAIPVIVFWAVYLYRERMRALRFLFFLIAAFALSEFTAHLLKELFQRPRPAVEWLIYIDPKALGFPSAHAMNTMVLAVLLADWFKKSFLWFLPLPLVVGASRVFANYHYPFDVIGGWFIGYVLGIVVMRLKASANSEQWR